MKSINIYLSICLTLFLGCTEQVEKRFVKRGPTFTGITFKNILKNTPQLNILNYLYYYNGAGVVAADFNNDGLTDLYFTGNETPSRLYLNLGNLKFEDITAASGIGPVSGWSTGATHVDINNDGLQDIYVCQASQYRSLKGVNQLFINQGVNKNGIPTFVEDAKTYGLDFKGLSTQAAFFDQDLDGDLDLFLLNHSVHPNNSYGLGKQREAFDALSGDRYYENTGGTYVDQSAKAGIYQGKSGYGLALSISDINADGYPDVYVGNDFYENDYLYINQQNGSFREIISGNEHQLGHTTHFSMGNAIADINNDGLPDILSLDMLPEELTTYKTSGLEYPYPIYRQYLNKGFAPQYMQNTLHLNLGDTTFAEVGNLAGISATEWSWGALMADWDNDGLNDIFISNGIKGATNDMDYMNFIANEDIQRRIEAGMSKNDMPLINELPEKKVTNYFFKNKGDMTFSNVSPLWSDSGPSFSNGCTYADLDNDGDLDIVVNNINDHAYILENTTNTANYLRIQLKGSGNNRNGIGSKIMLYQNGSMQAREHFVTQGYLSSKDHNIHFGVGQEPIDSVSIIWPDGRTQTLRNVSKNQVMQLSYENALERKTKDSTLPESIQLYSIDSLVPFRHKEQVSLDFDREPLIPFANSNQGPSISVADVNGDSLLDFFISGGKRQASVLYVQNPQGNFKVSQEKTFGMDSLSEDITSLFVDIDNDTDPDLIVASGGNEYLTGETLRPRLYRNQNGIFKKDTSAFKDIALNASSISTIDMDLDGHQDIILTANGVPHQFGKTPKQYIFQNNGKGHFTDVTKKVASGFEYVGNVTDIKVVDINQDGLEDFIAVGHWMPITIFINSEQGFSQLKPAGLSKTSGWWNSVDVSDFDKDGDLDVVCGNWGLNTKFKASKTHPITLYRQDFDANGTVDPIITYFHKDVETPFASKDELVKQLPFLNKAFLSYKSFAEASLEELLGKTQLKTAEKKYLYTLETTYFENTGKLNFKPQPLPIITQASAVKDIMLEDFNSDGYKDVLIVGNDYEISTQLGRLDAFHGLFLQNDTKGGFYWNNGVLPKLSGASRSIKKITVKDQVGYLIGRNNDTPLWIVKKKK